MLHTLAVLVVSVAPAIAFLVFILALDRREPEPLALVLKVIGLGAASAIPAAIVEVILEGLPLFSLPGLAGSALTAFIEVAPVEEACKLAVVLLYAWRKPAFNEENDGIVYAGASAIGFAVLENVIYVARGGLGTGVVRAFSAIPLHVFTAVIAGLFVGRARFVPSREARNRLVLTGFGLAWFFHGLYDAFAMSDSALALLLLPLLAGVAAFGILALRKGRRLSLSRWGSTAAPVEAVPVVAAPPVPAPTHRWMHVVARTLLAACALFWILLGFGLAGSGPGTDVAAGVLGGIMLTVIPLGVGIGMEIRWQRHRRQSRPAPASEG